MKKPATVAELMIYLQTLPPEAEVFIVEESEEGSDVGFSGLDLGSDSDSIYFADFTGHNDQQSVHAGKKILFLGNV